MLNLVKSQEYFDPSSINETIHIIGCGSVGSTLADHLARYGFKKFCLYDFDLVEEHNVVNQIYTSKHVSMEKVDALAQHLYDINHDLKIVIYPDGWMNQKPLNGYVFLCVDDIDKRREIVTANMYNPAIIAMFDFRTRLTEGQHYAARWDDLKEKRQFAASMSFTSEEAQQETEHTACGVEMGIPTTVRLLVDFGVANFIQYLKTGKLRKMLNVNMETFEVI